MIKFALGFVIGAWLLQQQSSLASLQIVCFLLAGSAVLIFLWLKYQKPRLIVIGLLAVCAGFLWANWQATIRLSSALPADWQQKSILIQGVVSSLPEVTERGTRFSFDVEKVLSVDKTHTLKLPRHISLNFYHEMRASKLEIASQPIDNTYVNSFHAGERWQLSVRLKRPHGTYNPHGFDFEAWALAENMRATGNIVAKSGYKKLNNFVYKPRYIVEAAREKIGHNISKALVNKPYAGVIRALVIGDDSQINATDWNVYLRTGINHLMSISGLHITMLAGLAFAITTFFWRRQPNLVMCMPTRKAATIVGLVAATLYALLAGMSVPTQRTLFMLITFALALLVSENLNISRALALAIIVVVLLDPWAVNAPGFWLSFSAVAVISYVSVGRLKAQHWLKEAVHTQWAVTVGLLPIIIAMFGQASIISPLANALAIPIISLIVVPLSIFGSLFSVDFVLHLAHWVLNICMLGLNSLAALPTWQQAAPPLWAVLVGVFGVLWLLLPRGFPQRWLGLILLLPLFFVQQTSLKIGDMQVAVLDVGQGLSVLVKTANHCFLYDAGPSFGAQSDAGSRVVVPYLRGEGIKKLDGFVVSHNDSDHSGGAKSVLAQVPVNWLASSFNAAELLPANVPKLTQLQCVAGQHWQWDKVTFTVLYPNADSYNNSGLSDNNKSCVIKITSAAGSILLTGDIEREAEMTLLNSAQPVNSDLVLTATQLQSTLNYHLKSDVLIAPHHGSKTSSTVAFLQAVRPKYTVFTVGYLNRFKHPKPMIEKRYEESGALGYRSDYNGAVVIDFKQSNRIETPNIKITAWRQAQPKYWHDQYASP